jgi:hypothetical protein
MAKTSYLDMTNKILRRVTQNTISDVTATTGHALLATNFINEAQTEIANMTRWYSLYATDTFTTVADTAEYAVPIDLGFELDLVDETNNWILIEDITRSFDTVDPNNDHTGQSTHFTIQGSNWRLYPIPAGAYTIRERYWKTPTTLAANDDVSDLPVEVENALFYWALAEMQDYLKSFEQADRTRAKYKNSLNEAKSANKKKTDRMRNFTGSQGRSRFGILPTQFPSNYPRIY